MYSHMMVGSNDIDRSKTFYDALFGAVGGKPGIKDDKGRLIYMHNGSMFLVTPPIDGQPATPGNGMTVGFAMESPEQADAWHAAGVRSSPAMTLYLAYLRDPDGNKLCALKAV
jgi:catechol 2,3-dioxygenase-like lactoylglutathione lyase family enzyme